LSDVPKETGFGDRHQVQQIPQLGFDKSRRRAAQAGKVFVLAHEPELLHAGLNRGRQGRPLAVVEAKPAALLDEVADGGKRS